MWSSCMWMQPTLKYIHVISQTTNWYTLLSLYFVGPITFVMLYHRIWECWLILIWFLSSIAKGHTYLSICCSQYYKHDFTIISSAGDLSAIYVVADFVKHLQNILHWIFQHKYFHQKYTMSGTKRSLKNQISSHPSFLKHEIHDRIGWG